MKRIGENGRNRREMIVFISCLSVAVPMATICDGKECEKGRLMPDWDALYLAKWLLIGLREPRTRWSRYSFSLLKCSLNCLHTRAASAPLGWRCVTCLTRLAEGLSSASTAGEAPVLRVSVCACLQGCWSSRPGFSSPPKPHLTRLSQQTPCLGSAEGLRVCGSSAGSLPARRRPDG